MSLNPQQISPVPEETARIAHAAYPSRKDTIQTVYRGQRRTKTPTPSRLNPQSSPSKEVSKGPKMCVCAILYQCLQEPILHYHK